MTLKTLLQLLNIISKSMRNLVTIIFLLLLLACAKQTEVTGDPPQPVVNNPDWDAVYVVLGSPNTWHIQVMMEKPMDYNRSVLIRVRHKIGFKDYLVIIPARAILVWKDIPVEYGPVMWWHLLEWSKVPF